MSEKLRIASIFIDLVKAEEKPVGKRRYEYDLYCNKDGNFPRSVFMLLTVPCVYIAGVLGVKPRTGIGIQPSRLWSQ